MSYFWDKASGLKADIHRHTVKEQELKAKIVELETGIYDEYTTEMYLRTYRNFLCQLQQSKAELTAKIGK